ncbi:hypothetical protein HK101_008218 [Irineochytrium annulatum]|nr:hypothetical protein HK101_008218 [Irineochytrium annulatum]
MGMPRAYQVRSSEGDLGTPRRGEFGRGRTEGWAEGTEDPRGRTEMLDGNAGGERASHPSPCRFDTTLPGSEGQQPQQQRNNNGGGNRRGGQQQQQQQKQGRSSPRQRQDQGSSANNVGNPRSVTNLPSNAPGGNGRSRGQGGRGRGGGDGGQGRGNRASDDKDTFGSLGGAINEDDQSGGGGGFMMTDGMDLEEDEFGTASKIDEMLEKRFQYGLDLPDEEEDENDETFGSAPKQKGRRIEDDDEDLNDVTFGDVGDLGTDFDFFGGKPSEATTDDDSGWTIAGSSGSAKKNASMLEAPDTNHRWGSPSNQDLKPSSFGSNALQQPRQQPPQGKQMMSLEEVEAEMRRRAAGPPKPTGNSLEEIEANMKRMAMNRAAAPPPQAVSLEEVEAEMRRRAAGAMGGPRPMVPGNLLPDAAFKNAGPQGGMMGTGGPGAQAGFGGPGRKMMSLEEIEAAMRDQQMMRKQQGQQGGDGMPMDDFQGGRRGPLMQGDPRMMGMRDGPMSGPSFGGPNGMVGPGMGMQGIGGPMGVGGPGMGSGMSGPGMGGPGMGPPGMGGPGMGPNMGGRGGFPDHIPSVMGRPDMMMGGPGPMMGRGSPIMPQRPFPPSMGPMGMMQGGPGGPGGPMPPGFMGPQGAKRPPMSPQQQQHMMNMMRQQQQQQQMGRPMQPQNNQGRRQEYGQMRYNDRAMQNQRELERVAFDIPRNYKGPPPLSGGWGGRRDALPRWERYKDTMTQYEKEMIAKIQIAQLVTDDPLTDDFYYQIYTSLQRSDSSTNLSAAPGGTGAGAAGGKDGTSTPPKSLTWQQSLFVQQGKGNATVVTNQMQQQMQKLIEGRKQKPKGTSLALEGALGKISLNSVKNPRQLIQIQANASRVTHSVPEISRLTSRKILKSIENVYAAVLSIEHMKRKGPDSEEDAERWNASLQEETAALWKELSLTESVPFTQPHPFPYFLSYGKGKRLIPRIIRLLTPEQILVMLTTILARAEGLDVCNMPAGTTDEQVDLFVTNVVPCMVAFVSEVPLHVVNACTRILLERHNMVWLARSRVGLAFLTMLLSRAEILKQGGGAAQGLAPPSAEDLSLWTDLYNFLFHSLHTHFASIFPPASTDPNAPPTDEVYVWQFLAAMAVGATTVDHQRVLVSEVRGNVIEASRRGQRTGEDKGGLNAKAVANVDLFLNALGLGITASQLAAMG